MLNRLARFEIDSWTRYAVVQPKNGTKYDKLQEDEISRKDVISRMASRSARTRVERFIIGTNGLFITFNDAKVGECVYSITPEYTFERRCKMKDWGNDEELIAEFEKKHKRQLAVEKLSGEMTPSLRDEKFNDSNNIRITVTKGDITYECPTHWEYISIDQRIFYVDKKGDDLVPVEIDYGDTLYYNQLNTYASYINIPKERMYIVINDKDYHEKDRTDLCVLYLDGKEVMPNLDKKISLNDMIKSCDLILRENINKQVITPEQFLKFNDMDVEFYVDIIDEHKHYIQ